MYTYRSTETQEDDLTDNGCASVYQSYIKRRDVDSTYANYTYLRDELRSVFKEQLNLNDTTASNMTFFDAK